jgi:chromate transporter
MSFLEVFRVFLHLGLTSFGGPVAHIGFFRNEFVSRRQWVTDEQFAAWLALSQFMPGPASSQLGFLIGLHRAGFRGALAAWVGFTLPSAIVLVALALFGLQIATPWSLALVQGLKLVAVAIVAQAVWGMWSTICRQTSTRIIALLGFALSMWLAGWVGQIGAILGGAILGFVLLRGSIKPATLKTQLGSRVPKAVGTALLVLFLGLLVLLPWVAKETPVLAMFDAFYRAGALVFGGGHVVLPLLESAVVETGLISRENFLVGYGLAQAVPGPLFTFAAWLGALDPALPGWSGALLALVAIFVPGLLLVCGMLPWWAQFQSVPAAFALFAGVNAAVVGVLAAAWVNPILTTGVTHWSYALIALICTLWLLLGKVAPWKVVLLSAGLALGLHWVGLSP